MIWKISSFSLTDSTAFVTVVLQLDRIVSVHVRRHFDKQTARREFTKATGLEELAERVERLTQEVRELSGKTQN